MNKERLLKLADYLENVVAKLPPERFNLGTWAGNDNIPYKGDPNISCGTSACACGWATTIPEFRAAGFGLRHAFNEGIITHKGYDGWEAAEDFFDLSERQAHYLFDWSFYVQTIEDITPHHVAARIREVVETRER